MPNIVREACSNRVASGWTGRTYVWAMSVLLLLISVTARAELVENLYQQGELVASQTSSERNRAASEALAKVLVRVSGSEKLLQNPDIQKQLQKPQRLIEAFRYESTDEVLERDDLPVPASRLVLSFSKSGIERLLRDSQAPLWPANRPSVLVWLVKDDLRLGRELVSLQDEGELSVTAADISQQRGLPLVLPMLDLEDRLNISADQVWNLDQAAIIEASSRYRADVLLIGRYSQTSSGRWISAWTLLHKQHQQVFDGDADVETELLAQGLNAATNFLSGIYSISSYGAASDAVYLSVHQVNGFQSYVRLLGYLESLEVVRQMDLVSLDREQVQLRVRLEGDVSALTDALELDRRLQPKLPTQASGVALPQSLEPLGSENNPLTYGWP